MAQSERRVKAEGLKGLTAGLADSDSKGLGRADIDLQEHREAKASAQNQDEGRNSEAKASAQNQDDGRDSEAKASAQNQADEKKFESKAKGRSRWFEDEDLEEVEDLIRKIKARLRGGSLYSGVPIDGELLALGARLGYLVMKKGARKLHDFASALLEQLGEGIRPYIKQFYNASLATEEALEKGWYREATPIEEVAKFDMARFEPDVREPEAPAHAQTGIYKQPDVVPVGHGVFGNIYESFKGDAKAAWRFLESIKSGQAQGVFHREEIGDIDLV